MTLKHLSIGAFLLALLLTLVAMDWSTHRLVAEFAEQFAAIVLHYGTMLGSIVAGFAVGLRIDRTPRRRAVAWACGIAVTFVLAVASMWVATKIPGVGWRINAALDAETYE
jgi:hypothetical protein